MLEYYNSKIMRNVKQNILRLKDKNKKYLKHFRLVCKIYCDLDLFCFCNNTCPRFTFAELSKCHMFTLFKRNKQTFIFQSLFFGLLKTSLSILKRFVYQQLPNICKLRQSCLDRFSNYILRQF